MKEHKKLLIRVDANDKIGYGHFYRSLSVAIMLSCEWKITFAISNPSPFLKQVLSGHQFSLSYVPSFNYSDPDSKFEDIHFDLNEDILEPFQVVLVDGYFFGPAYFEHLAKYELKVVTINDNPSLPLKAHALINSAPQVLQEDYRAFPINTLALGMEYVMLRAAFFKALQLPVIDRATKKLLISFGGADHFGITERITQECLQVSSIEEVHVIGRIDNNIEASRRLSDFTDKLIVHSNLTANEVVHLMRKCDLAILPASGVLFEAISCGLPFITCWYASNQHPFHRYLEESLKLPTLGFVKHQTSVSMSELLKAIKVYKPDNWIALQEMRAKMEGAPKKLRQLFNAQID